VVVVGGDHRLPPPKQKTTSKANVEGGKPKAVIIESGYIAINKLGRHNERKQRLFAKQ